MMMPRLKIGPRASLRGIDPEMAVVQQETPKSFYKFGHDCWLTSCVRPGDPGFHGIGRAEDFDSSTRVTKPVGFAIAKDLGDHLGHDYTCIWHKSPRGDWHLHVEADPDGLGIAAFKSGREIV